MNTKDFLRLGVPLGQATSRATDFIAKFILGGGDKSRLHEEVAAVVANPSAFVDDPLRGEFAKALISTPHPGPGRGGEGENLTARRSPVKYRQWGEGLEHDAVMQMEKACLLPISVAGALMPDAHIGYGRPIGGELAASASLRARAASQIYPCPSVSICG
jgi:tRNA-splicing ligase RtcB